MDDKIRLIRVKRTHPILLTFMQQHYTHPKGFVGRNIHYLIAHENKCYGAISSGSATRWLVGRDEFFNNANLTNIINNIFFHLHRHNSKYPYRNFSTLVIRKWRSQSVTDWEQKYGDKVIGYETLVELPRTGELYIRDGWAQVGTTKGYTCKRVAGYSTDNWTGMRIWNTTELRPKLVFCRNI